MKYPQKITRLVIFLVLVCLAALVVINGFLILASIFDIDNLSPLFTFHPQGIKNINGIDFILLSDAILAMLCISGGLGALYRAFHAFLDEIRFFRSDFYVLKERKATRSDKKQTLHPDLLSPHIVNKPAVSKNEPKEKEAKSASSLPSLGDIKKPASDLSLPNEIPLEADKIGATLAENKELINKPVDDTSIHDMEPQTTTPPAQSSSLYEDSTSDFDKLSSSLMETPASSKESHPEDKHISSEKVTPTEPVKAEDKSEPAKTDDLEETEEEFLTSLNISSLIHLPWGKKKKKEPPKQKGNKVELNIE